MRTIRAAIRQWSPPDMRRVVQLEKRAFGSEAWTIEMFVSYASLQPRYFLVAKVDARVAGYCVGRREGSHGEIDSIAVSPVWRRRGIASELLRRVVNRLLEDGATEIGLMVNPRNTAAVALYKRSCFVRRGLVPRYYRGGKPAWRMTVTRLLR